MLPNETKAIPENYASGSELANIYKESRKILKDFINKTPDKEFWKNVDARIGRMLIQNSQRPFATEVALAVRAELERETALPNRAAVAINSADRWTNVFSKTFLLLGEFVNGDQNGLRTNRYWDTFIDKVEELDKELNSEFAKDMILCVISEIHRKYRSELETMRKGGAA
ncbi:MAG: hypothetical protein J6D07_06000 [Mogibacterium sp.]|nr:hypothetical protein [Mogibacterium sp.]